MAKETIHMENLKRLEALWLLLSQNAQLSPYVTSKDREVFVRRVGGEGLPFLCEVLPRIDKALCRSFETGVLEPIEGFSSEKGFAYPCFMQRAFRGVFTKDGALKDLDSIDVGAVACIRQLTAVFYKLQVPYSDDKVQAVIDQFIQTDIHCEDWLDDLDERGQTLLKKSRRIIRYFLSKVNPWDIRPRHGSGSSACGVPPHKRYDSFRFIPRLAASYPFEEYFFFSPTHLCDDMDLLLGAEEADPSAKVVLVPKDSRGPRLISEEPREFMYIQQGLMAKLYDHVERLPAIARQIGFTDQTRNNVYAYKGSLEPSAYATLDLKEASDRVSMDLVELLFPRTWVECLSASRSQSTLVPSADGHFVHSMRKFAPMGSACCFPVEAIIFWALSLAAMGVDDSYIKRAVNDQLTETDVEISVFGDDIIVPTCKVGAVMEGLESVGLLVNKNKSYWNGSFRESCGKDFFNGIDVTPIRVNNLPSDDMMARYRTSETFNNLIRKFGYGTIGLDLQILFENWWGPVAVTDNYLVTDCKDMPVWDRDGNLSITGPKSQAGLYLLGPHTVIPATFRSRFNAALQRREYRVPVVVSPLIEEDTDRWSMVLKQSLQGFSERSVAISALPKRARIKYGWLAL